MYIIVHSLQFLPCSHALSRPNLSCFLSALRGQDEMGEARAVMRTLKEERDEIRSHLDGMQVCVPISVCVCVCML